MNRTPLELDSDYRFSESFANEGEACDKRSRNEGGILKPIVKAAVERYLDYGNPRAADSLESGVRIVASPRPPRLSSPAGRNFLDDEAGMAMQKESLIL
jgi:hypothetical protein